MARSLRTVPGAFAGVAPPALPPDDEFPVTNPFTASFVRHFPDLHTRAARTGHFIPDEDPGRTIDCVRQLLAW